MKGGFILSHALAGNMLIQIPSLQIMLRLCTSIGNPPGGARLVMSSLFWTGRHTGKGD